MARDYDIDLHQYARLRTILDSLTVGALRFYLNADTWEENQHHYAYLDKELTKIIEKIWVKPKEDDCPPGYINCDGCCVPYKCVTGGDPEGRPYGS